MRSTFGRHRLAAGIVGIVTQRSPQHGCRILDRELEALRHHPDNGVALVIERDGAAHDVAGGAEMLTPTSVAQHYDTRAAGLLVVGGEVPA